MDKAVVTCALNGVLTNPKQHHVPVTPEEMAREAKAAIVCRGIEAAEPQLASPADHLARKDRFRVPLRRVRRELAVGEFPRRLLERPLVFVQIEVHRRQRGLSAG